MRGHYISQRLACKPVGGFPRPYPATYRKLSAIQRENFGKLDASVKCDGEIGGFPPNFLHALGASADCNLCQEEVLISLAKVS